MLCAYGGYVDGCQHIVHAMQTARLFKAETRNFMHGFDHDLCMRN